MVSVGGQSLRDRRGPPKRLQDICLIWSFSVRVMSYGLRFSCAACLHLLLI